MSADTTMRQRSSCHAEPSSRYCHPEPQRRISHALSQGDSPTILAIEGRGRSFAAAQHDKGRSDRRGRGSAAAQQDVGSQVLYSAVASGAPAHIYAYGNTAVASAYDAAAQGYDESVAGDAWVRLLLWDRYRHHFRPGQRVLDVACGTGIDALFLARHGVHVHAIDVSPAMIRRLKDKVVAGGAEHEVQAQVLDLSQVSELPAGSFDGVISAFAGLNTVPDLRRFAQDAARALRPHGVLIVHMLNRFSVWEWLCLVTTREWAAARRLGRKRERTFVIGGHPVTHYLSSPREAYDRSFSHVFRLSRMAGIGALCPPATVRGVPRPIVRSLARLDAVAGPHRPFSGWGRFYVLELVRR